MFNLNLNFINIYNPYFLIILGLIILIGIVYLISKTLKDKKKVEEFLEKEYVVLSILVPKNNEKTPMAAEQMFASLHGILKPQEDKQEHISFEIASQDKFTQFYVCVRKELKGFVEGQIYAQYPMVEIKEVPDYTDVELGDLTAASTELSLTREDVYPIKTFQSFEVDPLAAITGVLTKVDGSERIWIQVLTRPVEDTWQDKGVKIVEDMREGKKPSGGFGSQIAGGFGRLVKDVIMGILSPPKPEDAKKEEKKLEKLLKGMGDKVKLPGPVETAMGGIETKIQKLGFQTKIRIMAISHDEETAKAKLLAVVGAFRQFNTTNLNGFKMGNIIDGHEALPIFQMRPFGDDGYIFNIEELASIYHLPHASVETPAIVWAGAKKGEPPANLPIVGVVPDDKMTILSKTNFRHHDQVFGIKMMDRRLHMYSIGKTGTGKSTLMENMIYDDLIRGRGIAIVDPHGQTIDHILDFIPEERVKDIVYLNPADHDFPIGFNLLERVSADQKNIVSSGLMSVFLKLWEGTFSARMEYILRNTILALLDYPNATMLGIMKVLNDKEYRKMVLSYVKDPVVLDFFLNEFEKYDPKFRGEAIAPIQNKVGQFLSASTIRNIVGQEKSTFNISEIMDQGKILLIDLSTGKIGEDNSKLLGSMMITKIQLAAMQRAHIPEEQRRDFYLYVDEFQNFATPAFAVILSEARKYHLNLVLTNQYTAQVPIEVMDAVMGNIGTMIAFRVGAPDASALEKEFAPVFEANDLVNQPNRHIYIKMAIDGVTCPAFSADTLPPRATDLGFGKEAIQFSRDTYGRPRDVVEKEIQGYMDAEPTVVPKVVDPIMEELRVEYKEVSIKGGYKWYLGAGEDEEEDQEQNNELGIMNNEVMTEDSEETKESVADSYDYGDDGVVFAQEVEEDKKENNELGIMNNDEKGEKEDEEKSKFQMSNDKSNPNDTIQIEDDQAMEEKVVEAPVEVKAASEPVSEPVEEHHIISSHVANKIAKKARKIERHQVRKQEFYEVESDKKEDTKKDEEVPAAVPNNHPSPDAKSRGEDAMILEEGEIVEIK